MLATARWAWRLVCGGCARTSLRSLVGRGELRNWQRCAARHCWPLSPYFIPGVSDAGSRFNSRNAPNSHDLTPITKV